MIGLYPIQKPNKLLGPLVLLFSFQRSKTPASNACQLHFAFYLVFDLLSTVFLSGFKQPAAQRLVPAEQRGANIQTPTTPVNNFLCSLSLLGVLGDNSRWNKAFFYLPSGKSLS
jgi:hypothetical protein